MKKIFIIGFKDIKIRARDFYSFLLLFVMPMILIFVLGLVFQNSFKAVPFKINAAIIDYDNSSLSKILKEDVFKSESVSNFINLEDIKTESELKEKIKSGELQAGVVIPQGFSESVMNEKETKIFVYEDPEQKLRGEVVRSIVETFTFEVSKRQIAISSTIRLLEDENFIKKERIKSLLPLWLKELQEESQENSSLIKIEKEDFEFQGFATSSIAYYAIGMGLMYMLYASNIASASILKEKKEKTFSRLMMMPVSKFEIMSGKLFGVFLTAFLQFILIIIFTHLFYKVNWGNSYFSLIILTISAAFAMSGIGAFLLSMIQSMNQLESIGPVVAMTFTFLGGGMWPIYVMPKWMNFLSKLTPNRWALDGFLTLMYKQGAGIKDIILQVFVLLLIGAVLYLVSLLRLKFD